MMLATEKAIEKAKQYKVALGTACHLGHYGSAGHYVRRAMQEGCCAFSVQGHHPNYFGEGGGNKGQQSAYWGNPPLCFGFPSEEEPPLVLDAATCILADYHRGPEYDALQELIPPAFFKSMGYTGSAMTLGGAFVGQNSDRARAVAQRWPRAGNGGLIIVMDIGAFAPHPPPSARALTISCAASARPWNLCAAMTRRPCRAPLSTARARNTPAKGFRWPWTSWKG